VRRPSVSALVVITGILLLADFLIVNESLGQLASIAVDLAIIIAAGAALAAVGSLGLRRGMDVWRRRGDPVGAGLVLVGIGVVLVAGLRPGSEGASDPAVRWILVALLIPIGATLFGLLFLSTLTAARRSVASRDQAATLLVSISLITLVLLLPVGGALGAWLAAAASWSLEVPIGAVFRGLLMGVAVLSAVFAARTLLGIGPRDE
jgi:multisubunit Na+/H+ antiporter MnhG subunit